MFDKKTNKDKNKRKIFVQFTFHKKILNIEITKASGARTAAESILEFFVKKMRTQQVKRRKITSICERKLSNIYS